MPYRSAPPIADPAPGWLRRPSRRTVRWWLARLALALGIAYATVVIVISVPWGLSPFAAGAVIAVLLATIVPTALVSTTRVSLRVPGEVFGLLVLPAWGYVINQGLPAAEQCSDMNRLMALPQANAYFAAYAATVLAYAVARRNPWGCRPPVEWAVQAALGFGILLVVPAAIHFGAYMLAAPLVLPLGAPLVVIGLYVAELRLRRRLPRALPVLSLAVVYGVGHAIWLGRATGALEVFTTTAAGTFATITPPPAECHYLCTIAAQGSPWLVRPLRAGVRRGQPIVVNRQLAVANAFEDLLHQRWPRFGRWARRTYDRLALPICPYLRRRGSANALYLLMKPAEWGFYAALWLFDSASPEARIDRMYR